MELQDIQKSYWKRKAGVGIGPVKGQLIFGDALYFRSPSALMDMIAGWPSEKGAEKIVMAIVISTLYGYFDYSLDILSRPECKQYLDDSRIDVLRDVIMKRSRSIAWKGMGAKYLSGLGRLLHRAFEGKQEDWARVGERFGNRKRFGMFG